MTLILRSSTQGPSVDAEVENYVELTELGWCPDTCSPAPTPFPRSTLRVNGRAEPPDFFFAGPVIVVSSQLRDVLRRFDSTAEYLPLEVTSGGRAADGEFCLVNILDWAECLDLEHSECKMTDHGAKGVRRLVIDEEATAGHHLFLVGQIPSRTPNRRAVRDIIRCASEELAEAVIDGGFTGLTFVRPEHHKTYPPGVVAWSP